MEIQQDYMRVDEEDPLTFTLASSDETEWVGVEELSSVPSEGLIFLRTEINGPVAEVWVKPTVPTTFKINVVLRTSRGGRKSYDRWLVVTE